MKKIRYFLTCFLWVLYATLWAQTGTVSGKVKDAITGEDLIGVSVVLKGSTNGTATDIDGNYALKLPAGKQTLVFSYVSYATQEIEVLVLPNEVVTQSLAMKSAQTDLGEVVISAKKDNESASTLILEQKNAVVVLDGISAEQMKKTPDRTTADVLRRVSGATIQDNSFVIIRGLPDRYNAAFINGAPLPSSEPDRKAFSFDIFPAVLLSDIKILKTAMPSVTGEFAGGIIQIRTKDIPDRNYYQVSLSTSFNTITTFSGFKQSVGGNLDWLGVDDGTRMLSRNVPGLLEMQALQSPTLQRDVLVNVAKQFNNNYRMNTSQAAPGVGFQFSMGHAIPLIKPEKRVGMRKLDLGSVFALTYTNNLQYREHERNDFNNVEQTVQYIDQQYNTNTSWGAVWNITLAHTSKKGGQQRISVKNLMNLNANDQLVVRTGSQPALGIDVLAYNMFYTQNALYATQVSGEHVLPKQKFRIEWGSGFSKFDRITPDYRLTEYRRPEGDTASPFMLSIANSVNPNIAGRFYSWQHDYTYSGNVDMSVPIKLGTTRHEIKWGAYVQYKTRDFNARQFGYVKYNTSGFDNTLTTWGIDSIFEARNMSSNGFMMREITRLSDSYTYQSSTTAGYIQLEHAFFEQVLKIVWGARIEHFRQQLNTHQITDQSPINLDTSVVDILPSINIIYNVHPTMNLRVSGSRTVNRPEARELAPFPFYDFSNFALAQGNDKLLRTQITNVDLRYEWFPAPGQLVSFTAFYKYFDQPIEKQMIPQIGRKFSYINVPSAYSVGLEAEFKFSIGSFFKKKVSSFWNDLSVFGNFAWIQSEVNLDSVAGVSERRPMQGQSPYILNGGIQYQNTKYNFGISWAANYIGKRIFSVGDVTYASIWEQPRLIMDVQLTKTFLKKKLELKLNVRDILASPIILYQDTDKNGSFEPQADRLMVRTRVGTQISFSVGYKF